MMSFELSPHASTGEGRLRVVRRGSGGTLPETLQDFPAFRFWSSGSADHVIDVDEEGVEPRSNWSMLLGILVALVVSGGLWAGVGFLIARLVR